MRVFISTRFVGGGGGCCGCVIIFILQYTCSVLSTDSTCRFMGFYLSMFLSLTDKYSRLFLAFHSLINNN